MKRVVRTMFDIYVNAGRVWKYQRNNQNP